MEQLFKVQDSQELKDPERVSWTWVKHLCGLVDHLNEMKTQMIGMSPKDTIGLKEVPLLENYPLENTLPEDGLHHYLLQHGKNMTTNVEEQWIEYGQRRLTG